MELREMSRTDAKTLVVGGLNGFIGSNTTEALVERGISCVVTRHKNNEIPRYLERYIGKQVFIEPADVTSLSDLQKIGEKHKIDGIVDITGSGSLKAYFDKLLAIFKVAQDWKVKRVLFSSTAGVYIGLNPAAPAKEDQPIPLSSPFPIIGYQKIVEIAASEFAKKSGISCICVRLGGMFGPGQDPESGFTLAMLLVHSAVKGRPANLQNAFLASEDDAVELCYIKDLARAIALLQTAEKLSSEVYNVNSGKATPNREVLKAVEDAVPGFKAELPAGRSPWQLPILDISLLREATGFSPKFDIRSAIQDYVVWLKAGNPK
jgi:UDP-glucose 4-epimerase